MTVVPADGRNTRALAALRIAVGVLFLIFSEYKIFGTGFTRGGGFQFWINRFLADGAYPFMVPVLKNFVLPHGTAIAFMVAHANDQDDILSTHFHASINRPRCFAQIRVSSVRIAVESRCSMP